MGAAESRYAEALFRLLQPEDAQETSLILSELASRLSDTSELRSFMCSPAVPSSVKKETVSQLLPAGTPDAVKNILALMIDRGRLFELNGLCRAFDRMVGRVQGRLDVLVTAVQPLDDDQLAQIRDTCLRRYGAKTVVIRQETDTSLLGGVRVRIGDICIDDTLRTRLNKLRTSLENMSAL